MATANSLYVNYSTGESDAKVSEDEPEAAQGGEEMKLTIEAEPKEIAALVLEIQERQEIYVSSDEFAEELVRKFNNS